MVFGAMPLLSVCGQASASSDAETPTIAEARAELLEYVGDVTQATGYRYGVTDEVVGLYIQRGHEAEVGERIYYRIIEDRDDN